MRDWVKDIERVIEHTYDDESVQNLAKYLLTPIIAAEKIALGERDDVTVAAAATGVMQLTLGLLTNPVWVQHSQYLTPVLVQAITALAASADYITTPAKDRTPKDDLGAVMGRALVVELAVTLKSVEAGGMMLAGSAIREIRNTFMEVM